MTEISVLLNDFWDEQIVCIHNSNKLNLSRSRDEVVISICKVQTGIFWVSKTGGHPQARKVSTFTKRQEEAFRRNTEFHVKYRRTNTFSRHGWSNESWSKEFIKGFTTSKFLLKKTTHHPELPTMKSCHFWESSNKQEKLADLQKLCKCVGYFKSKVC